MNRRELIGAAALLPLGMPLAARAAPDDLDWLLFGSWQGEGEFMGRPSTAGLIARMAVGDRFLEILWQVDTKGGTPRSYEGRGLYRPGERGWDGYWFDSSGAIRPLTASAGAASFRVQWGTPETERGTSTYALSGETLVVEDVVFTAQGPRAFATHRLKRRE
ncbi:MAG: hypothetical protein ACAH11_01780 [Sphingomonas sp.]